MAILCSQAVFLTVELHTRILIEDNGILAFKLVENLHFIVY